MRALCRVESLSTSNQPELFVLVTPLICGLNRASSPVVPGDIVPSINLQYYFFKLTFTDLLDT